MGVGGNDKLMERTNGVDIFLDDNYYILNLLSRRHFISQQREVSCLFLPPTKNESLNVDSIQLFKRFLHNEFTISISTSGCRLTVTAQLITVSFYLNVLYSVQCRTSRESNTKREGMSGRLD